MRVDEPITYSNEKRSNDAGPAKKNDIFIQGHSHHCSMLIERQEHLLIGISPFNSKFSPDYVAALLVWGHKHFSMVDVLLPDEESAVSLLLATDVPAVKAMRKTRKELNRHRRHLVQIIEQLESRAISSRVIEFTDCASSPHYQTLKSKVEDTYEKDDKRRFLHSWSVVLAAAIRPIL